MEKKINILCISDNDGGVAHYRCIRPLLKLDELFSDKFNVDFKGTDFDWNDIDTLKKYNIITFNKGDFYDYPAFTKAMEYCKANGIKIVLDLDDYWDLGNDHPLRGIYKANGIGEKVRNNIKIADYITTTTSIFANKIKKYNPNVKIFPNAIDPNDPQFAPDESKVDGKLRIGFVMGSTHVKDMEQLRGVVNSLDADTLSKIQFVLCGYDLRGEVTVINPQTGETSKRPIRPTETSWFSYECILTNDYKNVSDKYREFLLKFIPNMQYDNVENEIYRREWTKDLNTYGTHYNNIDVLFVPLAENEFNSCKSELKMIEAGFKNKGIVMSDFGPYKIGSKSIIKKGGEIDPEGNCILINPSKKHKDWAKAIKKLVNNPEILEIMRKNLRNHIVSNYDINDITKERAKFYEEMFS